MHRAIGFSTLVVGGLWLGATAAVAQSAGPIEAVRPDGSVDQTLALTNAQKHAIYDAVVRQRVRAPASHIPATVGAPVPMGAELRDLPEQASGGDFSDFPPDLFKYALVESDVVVVDPIRMQVVDVIHNSAGP